MPNYNQNISTKFNPNTFSSECYKLFERTKNMTHVTHEKVNIDDMFHKFTRTLL